MTWPFEDDTSTIIKKLAKADLKEHKLKTLITAIIIVIATCLMATVFSILVNDALKQSTQAPYHAMFRAVSEDTKNKLQTDNDFESVGVYKTFGNIVNSDGRTDLAYMDDPAMSFLGFELMDGNLPQSNTEVLVSETYLSIHKLALGDTFFFEYVDTLTNELKENTFTVCGIIRNKTQEKGKQFYILTSDRFRTEYAQQYSTLSLTYSTQTATTVDVLVSLNSENADMSPDTQKDFLKSKGEAGGIEDFDIILNDRYIDGIYIDGAVAVGIIFFAIFIMFASSFVIYSIFYISIVNSMPMYAQFISLGTTKKQLRYFLKMQGNLLALRFIPLGALISIVIVIILSGVRWLLYDMAIILLSGFLIFAVIKFALRKPAKLLAKTSPIEAMKFQGEKAGQGHKTLKRITPNTLAQSNLKTNQKKNRMSIISLSISGTLMIALAILISSINLPAMLRQSYPLDENFQIGIQMDNFYERFPTIIQDNPLSEDLQTQIYIVNELYLCVLHPNLIEYTAATKSQNADTKCVYYKIPGVEKIVLDGCVVGRLVESKVVYDSPEDNLETVNSLSPELVANASELVDGTINYDEIGLDGIVVNKYRTDRSDTNYGDLKIGDTLLFHFDVAGQTIEKTFTVAGIAYFPSTGLFYCTSEAIAELSPYNNTSHLSVFCDPDYKESVQDGIMALISGNPNLRLKIYDEEFSTIRGFIKATTSSLYGISAFVILFGLLNMVNMLISSAIVRKREFALLQAVGMTNQQLRKMLYREGMSISVKSAILATFLGVAGGGLLCYLANEVLALKFILFEFNIFPILLFSILLVGLQICISYEVSRSIEKDTLVERLRTE